MGQVARAMFALMTAALLSTAARAEQWRPPIAGSVTFFYYRSPEQAARFYEDVLGLPKSLDRGWVKVFTVAPGASVGLVEDGRGYHRAPRKPAAAMLSIETHDFDRWYKRLKTKNVKFLVDDSTPSAAGDGTGNRSIIFADPGGYTIEVFQRPAAASALPPGTLPERYNVSGGSRFEEHGSYSRAVIVGDWAFVSGTAGLDPKTNSFPPTLEGQARQSLEIIGAGLAKAGMSLKDVVRVNVYLADRSYIAAMDPILKEYFGETRPANTTVVVTTSIPEIKVEIEVTAVRSHSEAKTSG